METPTIIKKPKSIISPGLLAELATMTKEQGQVIVHCIQKSSHPTYIRIWPSTYLYDHHSDHRSELVHAENISYYPEWKEIGAGEYAFTLIFSGLTNTCLVFDLLEHCDNQAGAFRVNNITRNDRDVYYVQL